MEINSQVDNRMPSGLDISVIIPIYNSSKYLKRCLNSLVTQIAVNAEFICVDGGSTDDSYKICQEYADKDNRFKILKMKHSGTSAARNGGLDAAQESMSVFWILMIASSMMLSRNCIKKLKKLIAIR